MDTNMNIELLVIFWQKDSFETNEQRKKPHQIAKYKDMESALLYTMLFFFVRTLAQRTS